MNRKTVLTALTVMALATSLIYATCAGKTKLAPTENDTCIGKGSDYNGFACTYTAPSPSYDVCDTANTVDTGKICSLGPDLHSGIKTIPYAGKCLNGNCNNGTAQNEGYLMNPQPLKAVLSSCAG